ncbi:unnamed protein product [Camellia sinensis]
MNCERLRDENGHVIEHTEPTCCPCGDQPRVPSSCGNFFDKMMKGKANTAHCLRFPGDWFHVFGIGQRSVGFSIRIEVKTASTISVCSFCASLCYIYHLSLTYVLSFKLLQSAFIIFPSHCTIFREGFFPIFCLSIQFLDINNSLSYLKCELRKLKACLRHLKKNYYCLKLRSAFLV